MSSPLSKTPIILKFPCLACVAFSVQTNLLLKRLKQCRCQSGSHEKDDEDIISPLRNKYVGFWREKGPTDKTTSQLQTMSLHEETRVRCRLLTSSSQLLTSLLNHKCNPGEHQKIYFQIRLFFYLNAWKSSVMKSYFSFVSRKMPAYLS